MVTMFRSGDLVVLRNRWGLLARVGLAIGKDTTEDPDILVLWTTDGSTTELSWHLAAALLVIDDVNVTDVKKRACLGG